MLTMKNVDFDYVFEDNVMIVKKDVDHEVRDKYGLSVKDMYIKMRLSGCSVAA